MPNHEQLIPALCHYDLVGFQTDGDAANFARYLAKEAGHAHRISRDGLGTGDRVDAHRHFSGRHRDRGNSPGWRGAPIKTDLGAQGARTAFPARLMIGVDRLDYSKGIALRLEAYRAVSRRPSATGTARSPICRSRPRAAPRSRNMPRWSGAVSERGRPHQRHLSATRPGRRCAMSTGAYSRTALAGLYRAARVGAGDAAARRHESGGQGICRRPGRRTIPAC